MIEIELSQDERAELRSLDGERVTLSSPRAAAPGSRLEGAVLAGQGLASDGLGGKRLRIKVHRCVRTDDGFEIQGRLFDLTRKLRDALQERLAAG